MDQSSRAPGSPSLVAIASGTGGIQPLVEVLAGLPGEFLLPVLLLPGIPPDFVKPLAARLKAKSLLDVVPAEDGAVPLPGRAYIAANDSCLLVARRHLRLKDRNADPRRHQKDFVFRSMARDQGSGAVVVILSGLGADGAAGMKEVRDAGAYTIVEARSTSLAFETTDFAIRLDAHWESLPLEGIGPRLVALATGGPPNARHQLG
jgi:two-component system, chemotaxis family, protein-glutamate methylesterase/glutaminase